jgi:DNA-binding NarL/FixJ family response regulator
VEFRPPLLEKDCAMKTGRLLLADRHVGILVSIHGLLHGLFETVTMVADERSLREAIATLGPELVVVDLSLPGDGEADLVGRLMSNYPGLRLVVLGVYDQPEVAERTVAVGAAGFVLKRTAATDLIPAVRAVLEGGTFVSPSVLSA